MRDFKETADEYYIDMFGERLDDYVLDILNDCDITTAGELEDAYDADEWNGEGLSLGQRDACLYAFDKGARP